MPSFAALQLVGNILSGKSKGRATHKESIKDHTSALDVAMHYLQDSYSKSVKEQVCAIGHRVVHGKDVGEAKLVTAQIEQLIKDAADLAPLHNPANLQGIMAAKSIFPGQPQVGHMLYDLWHPWCNDTPYLAFQPQMPVALSDSLLLACPFDTLECCCIFKPVTASSCMYSTGVLQVAVFDTAFHQSMAAPAYMYALPYDLYQQHAVRKYGFHGTSYLYLLHQASKMLNKPENELNLIACHIGMHTSCFQFEQVSSSCKSACKSKRLHADKGIPLYVWSTVCCICASYVCGHM